MENWKKTGKIKLYTDLSTLSTVKGVEKEVDIQKNQKNIDISIVA